MRTAHARSTRGPRASRAVDLLLTGLFVACAPRAASPPTVEVAPADAARPPPSAPTPAPESASAASQPDEPRCASLAGAVPAPDHAARVFVSSAGAVCFEDEHASDDVDVEARAATFLATRATRSAVLYVDVSVPYARVVAVMDALRRGGLEHVSFAVQAER
jgi:biopolymer transport protein ExbD